MTFNNEYKEIIDNLNPSSELKDKLMITEENKIMKFSKKKALIVAAVACMIFGTTAFAAGNIASYRSWSDGSEESNLEVSREKAEKMGASLVIPEEFSNGYTFSYSNEGGVEGFDDKGTSMAEGKSFMATYAKDGMDDLILNIDPAFEPLIMEEGDICRDINGVDVYYYDRIYKFVPADYELTDEDKENMEKPGYEISYGSDEVEINRCSGFIFEYESQTYNMLGFDSRLTDDEWFNMAEELLAQ